MRWDLATGVLEPGAWIHASLYPRRCDVSPDGTYFYAFLSKSLRQPFMGQKGFVTYSQVSRLPWLFALAAWPESGTWTRGFHFVEPKATDRGREPKAVHGDLAPLRKKWALAPTEVAQYATERRNGFVEHEDCPPRRASDAWDEQREAILVKKRPRGTERLVLVDHGTAPRGIEMRAPTYYVERPKKPPIDLTDVTWADWNSAGGLLVATKSGHVQIRERVGDELVVRVDRDACAFEIEPREAPRSARRW